MNVSLGDPEDNYIQYICKTFSHINDKNSRWPQCFSEAKIQLIVVPLVTPLIRNVIQANVNGVLGVPVNSKGLLYIYNSPFVIQL